jgi:L-threonylcarbamoyladenylate synthase
VVAEATTPAIAPGQHAKHYAPRAPAYRFEREQRGMLNLTDTVVLDIHGSASDYARELYARLRELDSTNPRAIYVEMPPETPGWTAVRDRLIRATLPLSDAPSDLKI